MAVFHYPPDLFDLLVQTIPLLNRSKKSVVLFLKGAGVPAEIYNDIEEQLNIDKDSINKFEITRKIIERINEQSDRYLQQRREILKRVIEFEAFTTCWENDRLKAKGLISEIQKVVNVKDSFTRMKLEREKEVKKRNEAYQTRVKEKTEMKRKLEEIKKDFFKFFGEQDRNKRGKQLESILNRLFGVYGILIKEDFKRCGDDGEGIVEQIDGIIELDNQIYLVEMKWKNDSISSNDIYTHLGRIYHRTSAHGIYISASSYAPSAITATKEALVKGALLILFDLEELVRILEREKNLSEYIREKIKSAIIDKNPYNKMLDEV